MSWDASLISFLAILNPFALCLYLAGLMQDLTLKTMAVVLVKACLLSLVVFTVFAVTGDRVLRAMSVKTEAMRLFGGIIFFVVGYNYVTKGYKATEMLRGTLLSLHELPSAIALPFMIGAGTITQSILVGKNHTNPAIAFTILLAGVLVAFCIILIFKTIVDGLQRKQERVFERYVNTMARLNGLVIGAISTEMVITSATHLWIGSIPSRMPMQPPLGP